jgi:predicted metalloprotease
VTPRKLAFAITCASFGLAILGCAISPPDAGGPVDDGGGGTAPTTRAPRPDATGESLEGKFNYQTMDSYVDAIIPMITNWMDKTWPSLRQPQVVYVPHGASGSEGCLDENSRRVRYSADSYEYCGGSQSVYVGQDMLYMFYQRTGDAGPAVGLAHEFGHHIQQQVGVPSPTSAAESTRHEDQADCLAGAWTRYTDEQGWLEYPDDIEDIDALFPLIGSAEGPDRDHGTASERSKSFEKGFNGGVDACESFYPSVPLS